MKLTPDIIEKVQRIADVLEGRIDALPKVFYCSTRYTKSDCCKHLIEPLYSSKYQIDTLLKSLPSQTAKSLEKSHYRLISCFNQSGELIDKDMSLATIKRYTKDLIKELRSVGQEGKRNKTTKKQKSKSSSKKAYQNSISIKERFTFRPGQALFDNSDLKIGTGAALEILEILVKDFGYVVPFQKLDKNSLNKGASEKIRTAIGRIRKIIESAKIPVVIENRKNEGYIMLKLKS